MKRHAIPILLLVVVLLAAAVVGGYFAGQRFGARQTESITTKTAPDHDRGAIPDKPAEPPGEPVEAGDEESDLPDEAYEEETLRREARELVYVERLFPVRKERVRSLLTNRLGRNPSEVRVEQAYRQALHNRDWAAVQARNAETSAARTVAEQIVKEEKLRADKARGGPMTLLYALAESWTDMTGLVSDREEYAFLFKRFVTGPALDGSDPDSVFEIEDGSTVTFPAGQFEWKISRIPRIGGTFPKDLLIRGAGMNHTLVKFGEIDTRCEIYGLTFQDLTIDCGNDPLTDLRVAPALIRMIRCRVVRFDNGAGGSTMLDASTAAFYAEDCRFEGGYGRSPGSGNLVRGELLVRMERCTIVGPLQSYFHGWNDSSHVFENCTIERMSQHMKRTLEFPRPWVRFENCAFHYLTEEEEEEFRGSRKVKPLSDINPSWK
jgi:uncharacterized protein YneF (UPF0154 family)